MTDEAKVVLPLSVWTRIVLAARESDDWRLKIEIEQAVQQAKVPMVGWVGP